MKRLIKNTFTLILITLLLLTYVPQAVNAQQAAQSETNIDISVIQEEQPAQAPPYGLTSEGAVLMEQGTGKVLYGKQEHRRLYPASTTKILTALIAAEYGHLDETVVVGDEIWLATWDGSKAGLEETEVITLRNLVYGLLINSGNDAANTIAVHIARNVSGKDMPAQEALDYFAEMMNKRAKEAGALHSHFANPHGYHDPEHYTTAYDLAMIGREALKNEFFREAVCATAMNTTYWVSGEGRFWRSKNKILNEKSPEYYPWATGGKTGYTSAAGQCLITFASKNSLDLIAVVLKADPSMQWGETRDLLEYGFSNFKYQNVLKQGEIVESLPVDNYASGDWGSMAVQLSSEDWGDVFRKEDIPEIKREIVWEPSVLSEKATEALPRLAAPISRGQKIGELKVTLRGQVLTSTPLVAVRDVKSRAFLDILPGEAAKEGSFRLNWAVFAAFILSAFILLKAAVFLINRRRRRHYTMYRRF